MTWGVGTSIRLTNGRGTRFGTWTDGNPLAAGRLHRRSLSVDAISANDTLVILPAAVPFGQPSPNFLDKLPMEEVRLHDARGPEMSTEKYNTNLAAEYYVLSVLHRLGADANLTLGNKKSVDVVVVRDAGDAATVDVKGLAGTTSHGPSTTSKWGVRITSSYSSASLARLATSQFCLRCT